ncbi:MAG: hypothetical protein DRN12_01895 [Thermoplasmata archaeon]|nr:MAG: hypothetical protein DRN12_01895 [Thermoplasmata archaeon]
MKHSLRRNIAIKPRDKQEYRFLHGKNLGILTFIIVLSLVLMGVQGSGATPEKGFHPFHQYMKIEYDSSVFNQTFDIHKAINVPIKITYWTDMRGNLLKWMSYIPGPFWMIKNKILFGKRMPQQLIYLNITDKPDWADVRIVQPIVPMDIPTVDVSRGYEATPEIGETIVFNSSIIVSPLEEAPSKPYSIGVTVRCPEMGLFGESIFEKKITFRPKFLPKIQIKPEDPIQIALPHEAVNFRIEVTNYANKKMRIQPDIKGLSKEWSPTINPPFVDIEPGEGGVFYLSLFTPYDFGWHDATQTFKINFTATSFPIDNNSITGGPYQITLTVNNYGFALPGFEYLGVIAAMLIVLVIKRYRGRGR